MVKVITFYWDKEKEGKEVDTPKKALTLSAQNRFPEVEQGWTEPKHMYKIGKGLTTSVTIQGEIFVNFRQARFGKISTNLHRIKLCFARIEDLCTLKQYLLSQICFP